jgi:hypothetical protein
MIKKSRRIVNSSRYRQHNRTQAKVNQRKSATKTSPTRKTPAQSNHPKSRNATGRAKKATWKREVVRMKSREVDWGVVDVGEVWKL